MSLFHSCPKATQHYSSCPRMRVNSSLRILPAILRLYKHLCIYILYPHSASHFHIFHINSGYCSSWVFSPLVRIHSRSSKLQKKFFIPFCSCMTAPWPRCSTLYSTCPFLNIPTSITNNAAISNLNASCSSCENIPIGQIAGQSTWEVITLMMSPNCLPLEV